MKSVYKCGALVALAWLSAGGSVGAQSGTYGSPSLLPMPDSRAVPPAGYRSAAAGPLVSSNYGPSLVASVNEPVATPDPSITPLDPPVPPPANGSALYGTDSSIIPSTASPDLSSGGQCGMGSGCSPCIPCCNGGARWFGSVGGLAMTRNAPNAFWTTYQTNVNVNQLMETQQASGNWGSGGQVTLGRWWCCCGTGVGVQFVYWQLWGMGGYSNITSASNNLSTPIDLGGVNITSGAGTFAAGHFFDNSPEHRIWRTDNVTNLELNVLQQQIYATQNFCTLTMLAGFRYFRFSEALTFGSVAFGDTFGSNGGANEAYLRTQVTNNLFGAQIGMLANFAISPKCGAYIQPKVGAFGNCITARNQLYTGDGFTNFDIHSNKSAFSLLAEVDFGTYYWLTQNCQVFAGWRVIGVSQVALGDSQFLPYLADTAGYGTIKANGDLILTGGFAGLAFTF
jgi:hypothetical protein